MNVLFLTLLICINFVHRPGSTDQSQNVVDALTIHSYVSGWISEVTSDPGEPYPFPFRVVSSV